MFAIVRNAGEASPTPGGRSLVALVLALSGLASGNALAVSVADFHLPDQDSEGWSILVPASDSRLIYVDSTAGNDATGEYHLPSSPLVGPDPTRPAGNVRAFRTLAAAQAQLRQDAPDWLLLRAGGVWEESLPTRRGRSPSERMVATAWGEGPRPELRTGANRGLATYQPVNQAVVGLKFWAHTRDTDGAFFTGYEGSSGFSFTTSFAGDPRQVRDLLIEDCVFRSYAVNDINGNAPNEPAVRVVIRRSIISGNYKSSGHSQGLWFKSSGHAPHNLGGILLQENLFDHNGWRIQSQSGNDDPEGGQATIYNHNTYFGGSRNVVFQRNLFLRPSSIGNKWTAEDAPERMSTSLLVEDNLFADSEQAISLGGNAPFGPKRFADVTLRDNVIIDPGRSRPTNRSLAWGIEVIDWHSGSISRNLMIHQRTPITNTWMLKVHTADAIGTILVYGNVIANIRSGSSPLIDFRNGGAVDDVLFAGNIVQSPTATPLVSLSTGGYGFAGRNRYHSLAPANALFRINGANASLAQWIAGSGDSQASVELPQFPEPGRDIEGYVQHLGLGTDFDDFLTAVHGQSRANWNPALTAGAINDWLRAGFGMAPVGAGDRIFADDFEP